MVELTTKYKERKFDKNNVNLTIVWIKFTEVVVFFRLKVSSTLLGRFKPMIFILTTIKLNLL